MNQTQKPNPVRPQSGQQSAVQPWATITARLPPGASTSDEDPRVVALAGLLAEDDRAAGVETRDNTTLGFACERTEIIVYTAPEHVEGLTGQVAALGESLGLPLELESAVRHDDDWRDKWKEFYRPLYFGQGTLLVRPSWIERADDDPPRELVLDPGRAFGTGYHESTQLCLEALIELWRPEPDRPRGLLDVGCGSGLLALSACRLWGAALTRVVAIDCDPEAVATTRENAALNDVLTPAGGRAALELRVGTAEDLEREDRFDLIVANIRPTVLVPAAPTLAHALARGGHVILGGILVEEGDAVAAAYRAQGLVERARPTLREWCALHLVSGASS